MKYDSRLLFETNKTYINKVEWIDIDNNGSEWKYLGIDENIDETDIKFIINEIFKTDNFNLIISRSESFNIDKNELITKVLNIFRSTDFTIWDSDFNKIVEYNKIGIYRIGIKIS
jgi:hypothetical protein